jgi:hypothetical protein
MRITIELFGQANSSKVRSADEVSVALYEELATHSRLDLVTEGCRENYISQMIHDPLLLKVCCVAITAQTARRRQRTPLRCPVSCVRCSFNLTDTCVSALVLLPFPLCDTLIRLWSVRMAWQIRILCCMQCTRSRRSR